MLFLNKIRIKQNKLSLPNKDNCTYTNVSISQYLVLKQEIRESFIKSRKPLQIGSFLKSYLGWQMARYIYILANCQVGDFTILTATKLNLTLTLFDNIYLL